MNERIRPGVWIIWMGMVLFSFTACGKQEKYVGNYQCEESSDTEYKDLYVELKDGGKGVRRVRGEEVSFSWVTKGDGIRIHTDSGGVIVGTLENGTLKVELPGPKIIRLKKIK
jgi:hypothetical protein